ncbi:MULTISPECIES: DUF5107 domain-containing protein [unclassified Nocardioides]|uniref:DUF5107 domain-containing protein n=1 Tax=unclassified Nocardioides TaxID=2615069 RepID=UPI003614884E
MPHHTTRLRLDRLAIPAAGWGAVNPLPPLVRLDDPHDGLHVEVDDRELRNGVEYGHLPTVLPYLLQDGYDRHRVDSALDVAVLRNDVLRATFLLGLGGRLWSLVHLASGRELLHRNSVLQPANLGLRNAWFAGGVEWNLGTTGHTTLTCEPLHAVRVDGGDDGPVLRLYEYERTRGLVYSLDFCLPPGSPVLYVEATVRNPNPDEVPVYWWSNMAVPETPRTRVVVPADTAYHVSYDRRLGMVPVPEDHGRDLTWPATATRPGDWFFDCRDAARPYISALEDDGRGLAQVSTRRLVGRKLFVWGGSPGGRRWQEFLSGPGQRYLEIQAGLARTQLEHEPLAGGERVSWVEAYGLVGVDPAAAHGSWDEARSAVQQAVDDLVPAEALEERLARVEARAEQAPAEVLQPGSGWGALEEERRRGAAEPPLGGPGTPFDPDTLGPEQQPWLDLLRDGRVAEPGENQPPPSYVVGPAWRRLLDDATDDWVTWLHRGVAAWHAGDADAARAATTRSVELQPTPWGLRNLAAMEVAAGNPAGALEHYRRAHPALPMLRPLAAEYLVTLLDVGAAAEALSVIDGLVPEDRAWGRVRLSELRAALDAGDLDRAGAVLDGDLVVEDVREGEVSLESLWFAYHEARGTRPVPDLPERLDFRMG